MRMPRGKQHSSLLQAARTYMACNMLINVVEKSNTIPPEFWYSYVLWSIIFNAIGNSPLNNGICCNLNHFSKYALFRAWQILNMLTAFLRYAQQSKNWNIWEHLHTRKVVQAYTVVLQMLIYINSTHMEKPEVLLKMAYYDLLTVTNEKVSSEFMIN